MGARLDPGVFVEVARAAADLSAYESVVLEELDRRIGIDSGFFMRRTEPGPTGYGLFDDARRRACAGRWGRAEHPGRLLSPRTAWRIFTG